MSSCTRTLAALLAGLWAGTALAQAPRMEHAGHSHPATGQRPMEAEAVAAFAAAARAATERYQDRAAAIADGFRLLGPDFPAMGEHWVHPARMVGGVLEVSRPQALSYATIGGRPVLVGVIYARPLRGDEPPPSFPVAGYPWHDHVGAIDEESVLLHHVPSGEGSRPGVRLAMLHAWVWRENPDGLFAADNWALPFARLQLDVPERILPSAARALSLISGADVYYAMLFRALASPTPREEGVARERIRDTRARVERWYAARSPADSRISDVDQTTLAEIWSALWTEVGREVRPEVAARLQLLVSP